jgi:PKD repeat protein
MWTIELRAGSSEPVPNVDPVAEFSFSCDLLVCSFDGSGSADSDGTVQGYAWDFGGEGSAAVVSPDFTFAAEGEYLVSLTVTDDEGATDSIQQLVVVSVAPVSDVAFRDAAVFRGNVTRASVDVPDSVQAGDSMLLFASTNTGESPVETPAGWTSVGQTLDGTILTILYSRVAQAGDAGGQVSFDFPVYSKTDLTLLVYSGTDATDPIAGWAGVPEPAVTAEHSTPAVEVGSDTSWVVSYWIVKSGQVSDWSLPTGQVQRSLQVGGGGGHLASVAADTDGPAGQGTWPGATATADAAAGRATMWTIELR